MGLTFWPYRVGSLWSRVVSWVMGGECFWEHKIHRSFYGQFLGREILDPLRGKTGWKKKIPLSIPISTFITVRIFPIGDSDAAVSHEWDSDACVTWSRLWENWNFLWFMQPTYYITLQVTLSTRVSTHAPQFSSSLSPYFLSDLTGMLWNILPRQAGLSLTGRLSLPDRVSAHSSIFVVSESLFPVRSGNTVGSGH